MLCTVFCSQISIKGPFFLLTHTVASHIRRSLAQPIQEPMQPLSPPCGKKTARPNALLQSPLSFNREGGGEDGSAIGSLCALLSHPLAECMQLCVCVCVRVCVPASATQPPPAPTCKLLGWLLMLSILGVLTVEASKLWFLRLGGPTPGK